MSLILYGAMDYDNIDEDTKTKILQLHDPAETLKTLRPKTVQEMIRKNFWKLCWCWLNWKETQSEEENKIMRIFCRNSYHICGNSSLYSNDTERGLYNNMSRINHSCVPNSTWCYVMGDFKRHQVRALMTIEKDQEILINIQDGEPEFHFGSREFRRQELLETSGFLCVCSECSLEGEALEDNEKMRADIRENEREIDQLMTHEGNVRRRSMKKFMKLSQERMNLVEKLGIRGTMFVLEMMSFYAAATKAKEMGVTAPDPNKMKQEALKHAQICGDGCVNLFFGHK